MHALNHPFSIKALPFQNLISRSPLPRSFLVVLALGWFALLPPARAVTPIPDGDYGNFNTAEGGQDTLLKLTTGSSNTAIGGFALSENQTGSSNTAIGAFALRFNAVDHNTAIGFSALIENRTGTNNTATGYNALGYDKAGDNNTATGAAALGGALGSNNTANGYQALVVNSGDYNTATGVTALKSNQSGSFNTANGVQALFKNTSGTYNTATGISALYNNTSGTENTASGVNALFMNTASYNTAMGAFALNSNTTGGNNTGIGVNVLYNNISGGGNTATGTNALFGNKSGASNTANGSGALQNNTGSNNTATGASALIKNIGGLNNTAIGMQALNNNQGGSNNIALGSSAGSAVTGSNNIDIANAGLAGESGKIRIGTATKQTVTFITGIRGVAVPSGVGVIVGTNHQLGTVQSSARFKDDIKPMDKGSEVILALKPVTFRYKEELDLDHIPQFGLIAEDVEKVNSDLVARDENGEVTTVRYDAVNAMLLNEFLKEHQKVKELKEIVGKEEATNAQQQKQIEALTATVQKVSDQLELSQRAPQVVANDQQRPSIETPTVDPLR